jgi:glucosamine--fructose-6-phosphate aminotransferase (isomerizing)
MCGIVGYIGNKKALPVLLQGLRDLEYRGYDSSGVAVLQKGALKRIRQVGKVDRLARKIKKDDFVGSLGIAHTRWATHGGVEEKNAHPQLAGKGKFALVHNGIIENYLDLKKQLKDKRFESDTDTEVLAKWIFQNYKGNLAQAVRTALLKVRGTYGILATHADHPDEIVAARLGSPLVVGIGDNEYYIASDVTPILPFTKQVIFLDDGEVAKITREGVKTFNLKDEEVSKGTTHIEWDQAQAQKNGFAHFMLKEIYDQPQVMEDALRGRMDVEEGTAHLGGISMTAEKMRSINRVVIIAEGTARHAGLIAKYAFERLADLPCEVDFSSEFRYRDPIIDSKTLVFALSQSGETADTLMAAREAKRKGAVVRGIINVVGSTIARETGAGTYIHAGPELAVASTKAYTNMVAVMLLYALQFGRLRNTSIATGKRFLKGMLEIPEKMNEALKTEKEIKKLAKKYLKYKNILFIGRGVNYPVALEGALKLKEISYIHCEGFAGGEMKHGPLALVSKDSPVIAILTKDQLYDKMKSSILEAKARGARILLIANKGDKEAAKLGHDVIYVPETLELLEPLLTTIPLQLLAYYVSLGLKRDVDRPRNLAKSVTVE